MSGLPGYMSLSLVVGSMVKMGGFPIPMAIVAGASIFGTCLAVAQLTGGKEDEAPKKKKKKKKGKKKVESSSEEESSSSEESEESESEEEVQLTKKQKKKKKREADKKAKKKAEEEAKKAEAEKAKAAAAAKEQKKKKEAEAKKKEQAKAQKNKKKDKKGKQAGKAVETPKQDTSGKKKKGKKKDAAPQPEPVESKKKNKKKKGQKKQETPEPAKEAAKEETKPKKKKKKKAKEEEEKPQPVANPNKKKKKKKNKKASEQAKAEQAELEIKEPVVVDDGFTTVQKGRRRRGRAALGGAAGGGPKKPAHQQVEEAMKIPRGKWQSLMGNSQANFKLVQWETSVSLEMTKSQGEDFCIIKGSGDKLAREQLKDVLRAKKAIEDIMEKGFSEELSLHKGMTIEKLQVPSRMMSVIIGRQGANLQNMQDQFDVEINTPKRRDRDEEAPETEWITLKGPKEGVAKCKASIEQLIKTGFSEVTHPGWGERKIMILNRRKLALIGKGGSNIRAIQKNTGCRINIPKTMTEEEKRAELIEISIIGPSADLQMAHDAILEAIEEPMPEMLPGFAKELTLPRDAWAQN